MLLRLVYVFTHLSSFISLPNDKKQCIPESWFFKRFHFNYLQQYIVWVWVRTLLRCQNVQATSLRGSNKYFSTECSPKVYAPVTTLHCVPGAGLQSHRADSGDQRRLHWHWPHGVLPNANGVYWAKLVGLNTRRTYYEGRQSFTLALSYNVTVQTRMIVCSNVNTEKAITWALHDMTCMCQLIKQTCFDITHDSWLPERDSLSSDNETQDGVNIESVFEFNDK